MLEVFAKFVEAVALTSISIYIIKNITNRNIKLNNIRTIVLLVIFSLLSVFLHQTEYKGVYTITIIFLNIWVYKTVFNFNIEESILVTGVTMICLLLGDLAASTLLRCFYSLEDIRSSTLLSLLANLIVIILGFSIINIKVLKKQLQKFYTNGSKISTPINIAFVILLILGFCFLGYNITSSHNDAPEYFVNVLAMAIFGILAYIFLQNKNEYSKLTDEYDSLFSYIQTFEDWIEKEQLNRHEYKNQLAVLRCMTKERKVKDKIDEILEDNINIEGDIVHQLKILPKGGIKGLMYYKVALAQKKKINVEVNVSLETKSELSKLKEKDIRVLCKLIGIYLDNAIEAAVEPRKKKLLIEVYEVKDKISFVFSNTFKKHKIFNDRNKKGVSSKGEGRGNGLYFAANLISKNEWLYQKQEIVDGYYIQQLIITKRQKK